MHKLTCVVRISPWENGPHESSTILISLSYPDASPWRRWKKTSGLKKKTPPNNNKPTNIIHNLLPHRGFRELRTITLKWQVLKMLKLEGLIYFKWTFQRIPCHTHDKVNRIQCFNSDRRVLNIYKGHKKVKIFTTKSYSQFHQTFHLGKKFG